MREVVQWKRRGRGGNDVVTHDVAKCNVGMVIRHVNKRDVLGWRDVMEVRRHGEATLHEMDVGRRDGPSGTITCSAFTWTALVLDSSFPFSVACFLDFRAFFRVRVGCSFLQALFDARIF